MLIDWFAFAFKVFFYTYIPNSIRRAKCTSLIRYFRIISDAMNYFLRKSERVLSYLREKYEYSRPDPARPDPNTLFKVLYHRNRMSDRQAVFFDEYHLDVKVVWHGYHIASVPVMVRGVWQTWGTLDDPQNILPQ